MNIRLLCSLAVATVICAAGAPNATAAYPAHEVWFGIGGGSSPEKRIFNVPSDLQSSPDAVISFGYMKNLDGRKAIGIHLYGGSETTPAVTLTGPSGTISTGFDLNTFNLGVRYRHTFLRGGIAPYGFMGASAAYGSVESPATGTLVYKGFSGCLGPGAAVELGRRFMLSAELFASFGSAQWNTRPFANSSDDAFDPSLLGGTLNISLVWGRRE